MSTTEPHPAVSLNDASDHDAETEAFISSPTSYLIITASGKPVFSPFKKEEVLVEYGAIIQAIVAFFEDGLRSFKAKDTLFVVHTEFPLILIAIDHRGQSEHQLRTNLDILHAQILSTLTKSQLIKAFKSRPNRDLRPLLEGTEKFLDALCAEMQEDTPSIWLGAIEALALKKHVRNQIHQIFLENRTQDLLYGLVVSEKRLVSVIRPRRHSLHPPDLFLLFSMMFNTSSFKEGEHWTPICFPRFNSNGFLYTYLRFVTSETAIILVSPSRDAFFEMQKAGNSILEAMQSQELIDPITEAVQNERLKLSKLKTQIITHFLYKSKRNVQFIQSDPLPLDKHGPIMAQYKRIQAFAQASKLTIHYTEWQGKVVLGWFTPAFELYCVTTVAPKDALNQDLRKLITWIRKHEERLFIVSGATF